jgi:hypothetical protein
MTIADVIALKQAPDPLRRERIPAALRLSHIPCPKLWHAICLQEFRRRSAASATRYRAKLTPP